MRFFTNINYNLVGAVLSFLLLMASFYFQYIEGLQPCSLCIVQRILIMLLMLLFSWGIWLRSIVWLGWQGGITLVFALLGAAVSIRHLYVQYFPGPEAYGCSPSIDYMLQNWPLSKIGYALFEGYGSCSDTAWQWLGLSMPAWTLIFFLLFTVLLSVNLLRGIRHK